MKPILYIQTDLFSEDENDPNASRYAASPYFETRKIDDSDVCFGKIGSPRERNSGFRASLDYAHRIGRKFEFTDATKWLPRFRELCVSDDAYFTDMHNVLGSLWQDSGKSQFVRPTSGFKTFSGNCYNYQSFKNESEFLKQNKNIHPRDVLCMVAQPRIINYEWRLIYIDGKYISGSHYMTNGKLSSYLSVPMEALTLANHIAAQDYFANNFAFVLDIAMVEGKFRLIEVNAFETASFYKADLNAVYKAYAASISQQTLN